MARIQFLPPYLWTGKPLDDRNMYIFSYVKDVRHVTQMTNVTEMAEAIKKANEKHVKVYASAFVEGLAQHCVIYSNLEMTPRIKSQIKLAHDTFFRVNAKPIEKSVPKPMVKASAKPMVKPAAKKPINDKLDKVRIVTFVKFDGSDKEYAYLARSWHLPGEKVTVKAKDELTVVTTVRSDIWRESQVEEFAYTIGYKTLQELYCEYAIELPKTIVNTDGETVSIDEIEIVPQSKIQNIDNIDGITFFFKDRNADRPAADTDGDADIDYEEDIAELEEMRKAFEPPCDFVVKEPEGYIYGSDDEYDCLPE